MGAICSAAVPCLCFSRTALQNVVFGTLSEVSTEEEQNNEWVEFQGYMDCSGTCDEFLNVDKLIPTTDDKTNLDGPSCKYLATLVTNKEEEIMEGIHLLLVHPAHKEMILLVFDSTVSSCNINERIIKVMDKLQDFVSKAYKKTLKQRFIELYFKTR